MSLGELDLVSSHPILFSLSHDLFLRYHITMRFDDSSEHKGGGWKLRT